MTKENELLRKEVLELYESTIDLLEIAKEEILNLIEEKNKQSNKIWDLLTRKRNESNN